MKNIIQKILEEKYFSINEGLLEDENSFLAQRTEDNKFDFLTVMFVNKDELNKELIKEKMEKILQI